MKSTTASRRNHSEGGVALLMAIVTLLLIGVVAAALILAASTESSLAGNYRSASTSYYAAVAGLEEGRGRLLPSNPNYFGAWIPQPMPLGTGYYVTNPNPATENVLATYPDTQYAAEFGAPPATQTTPSVFTGAATPGPLYKWVRINAITEKSINKDVNNDGVFNNATALYYDNTTLNLIGNGNQAYEITTLAVLPNGTQKMMQYIVSAVTPNLRFPSALTLDGSVVSFFGAHSNPYKVNGTDRSGNGGTCATPPLPTVPSVGVPGVTNIPQVVAGIPRPNNYTGTNPPGDPCTTTLPNVCDITSGLNPNLRTPAAIEGEIAMITQNADVIIQGNATQANMPYGMSPTNPMTVVVNGDFSMTGGYTGYGLLVVTGNFAYSGDCGWKGVVLVIGNGTTTFLGNGSGNNEFDGAIYVAATRDVNGVLLPTMGTVNFDINGGGGAGIYYNSCWISAAQKPRTYKVLSFHEIPQ